MQHGAIHRGFSRDVPGQQSLPADPLGRSLCRSPVVMGGQAGTSQSEAGPSSYSLCTGEVPAAPMEMCPLKPAVVRWAEEKMKHQRTNC